LIQNPQYLLERFLVVSGTVFRHSLANTSVFCCACEG